MKGILAILGLVLILVAFLVPLPMLSTTMYIPPNILLALVGGLLIIPWADPPRLGSGARFRSLTRQLAARRKQPVRNPRALAAYIGRQKYGKQRFQRLAAAGRRRR